MIGRQIERCFQVPFSSNNRLRDSYGTSTGAFCGQGCRPTTGERQEVAENIREVEEQVASLFIVKGLTSRRSRLAELRKSEKQREHGNAYFKG